MGGEEETEVAQFAWLYVMFLHLVRMIDLMEKMDADQWKGLTLSDCEEEEVTAMVETWTDWFVVTRESWPVQEMLCFETLRR